MSPVEDLNVQNALVTQATPCRVSGRRPDYGSRMVDPDPVNEQDITGGIISPNAFLKLILNTIPKVEVEITTHKEGEGCHVLVERWKEGNKDIFESSELMPGSNFDRYDLYFNVT